MLSIIIPCHNEARFVGNLLQSLERQSSKELVKQIIVVINASTDDTEEKISEYITASELPIQVAFEPLLGVSRARNLGASLANGSFLLFLDADIIASPKLIEEIGCRIAQGHRTGTIRNLSLGTEFRTALVFRALEFIKVWFKRPFGKFFVETKLFNQLGGFNERIQLGENVEFLRRAQHYLKRSGSKIAHIRSPLYSSDRRFKKRGYASVLLPWLIAYLGNFKQSYPVISKTD